MTELQLLDQLLSLASPWRVSYCRAHEVNQVLDIWIDQQEEGVNASWLQKLMPTPSQIQPVTNKKWRHLNIGQWKVYLHSPSPELTRLANDSGIAALNSALTIALSQEIEKLLQAGVSLTNISQMLMIELSDFWRYKREVMGKEFAQKLKLKNEDEYRQMQGQNTPALPNETHSIWTSMIDGKFSIDIKALGLNLLLAKIQSNYKSDKDKNTYISGCQELYRHFERNQMQLVYELLQIHAEINRSTSIEV